MSYVETLETIDEIRHVSPGIVEADLFYITVENDCSNMVLESIEQKHPSMLAPRRVGDSIKGNPIIEIKFGENA